MDYYTGIGMEFQRSINKCDEQTFLRRSDCTRPHTDQSCRVFIAEEYMGSIDKTSMVNTLQFMASSFCMITLARSSLRSSRGTSIGRGGGNSNNLIDRRYASTLMEMFKATKVPNKRHGMNCSDVDTTENIFKARCEFFRKAIIDYNLQDVKFIHIAGTKGKGCFYVLLLSFSCYDWNQTHFSPWYGIAYRINV